ncbi:MAG: hypothetical protein C0424_11505 [Sphingobacteriaceae bacterium]|nr:hypothetical protein [Sphingobacteriaceae bacterium]
MKTSKSSSTGAHANNAQAKTRHVASFTKLDAEVMTGRKVDKSELRSNQAGNQKSILLVP